MPRFMASSPTRGSGVSTLLPGLRKRPRQPASSQALQELQARADELKRCAEDIEYWVNTYCWTFDPRETESDPVVPFKLFPRQAEFLLWIRERERDQRSGVAEKSRDVGFTWLCCAYAVHGWLFRRGFAAGFGSRKLELVDKKGDPKCIFEKIRFLVQHLPDWMLPEGYNERIHSGFAKLLNPSNNASITGEGGSQIGRGGRNTVYFVDEAAFLQHPKLADAALSATSRVKIWVSTPNGMGNSFYEKRFGGRFAVFTFHWRDDPRKDDAWYEQQKDELDPVTLAQEVDIDYSASIEGICIPAKWVRAAVDFAIPGVSKEYPLIAGFDPADGGKAKSVFIARRGPVVLDPLAWGELSAGEAADKAAMEAQRLGVDRVNYDAIGVGTSVQYAWDKRESALGFVANGVKWGDPPTNTRWPSRKTSAEMFVNLRAELWWILRTRFEKTWQVVNEGAEYPPDELISIPNCPELISQLSTPLCETSATGKIQLESKPDMSKRGVSSPDYGDALAYSFAPDRRKLKFFSG